MGILNRGFRFTKGTIDRWFTNIVDVRHNEVELPFIQSLKKSNGQDRVLLNIPLEKCRTQVWNTLEREKNPFVETIIDYSKGIKPEYNSSAIHKYYEKYQPQNAAEVLRVEGNEVLTGSPSIGYVFPWDSYTLEETIKKRERVALSENCEMGSELGLSYGYTDFGPVHYKKGEIEFNRLVKTYESIKKKGYIEKPYLSDGGIRGYFLVDKDSWCFIVKAGKHRAYALSALGADYVPIILDQSVGPVVQKGDILQWAQVINRTFTEKEASLFVDNVLNLNC